MSIPQPPAPPPPQGINGAAEPKPSDRSGRRRLLADAAGGLALLLALLIVFLLDRNAAGRPSAFERKFASTTIFDPLATPIAEVREYPNRQRWIGAFGGTSASEVAVRLGLDWLARHQAEDGHWGPDCLHLEPAGCCRGPEACPGGGSEHCIAQTGLALLAFQAAGHYDFNGNEFSPRVRRGLDWLVATQRADGAFLDRATGGVNMYEHGIATFALADACEMADSSRQEPADRYRQAAQQAVQFIEYSQHNDGGWRYTPERELPSDTSVSGWQVLAMKAAKRAGIVEIGEPCVASVEAFFKRCEIAGGAPGRTGYQPGQVLSDATTGVGMLVHEMILEQPNSPLVRDGAKYLADVAEHSSWKGPLVRRRRFAAHPGDFYTWYNCTLAMFLAGGEPWKRWNDAVRDHLVRLQCKEPEGCANGSWDPDGHWSPQGGRVYSTALAVLTLEVYYRYKSQQAQVYEKP
ncbi:MAG: prenyltransferase/squalene oxidase repeat-containing protein [Thermoguttaceae bacterium]|jgi:hypothetical protein